MRIFVRVLIIAIISAGVLTQFTNCDVYSENSAFGSLSSTSCGQSGCVGNKELLSLTTVTQLIARSAVPSADLGGDCNEGGFPDNKVTWELLDSAKQVLKSCTAGDSTCSKCINGRFHAYINFTPYLPQAGLSIRVEVFGIDSTAQVHSNWLRAQKIIPITAF